MEDHNPIRCTTHGYSQATASFALRLCQHGGALPATTAGRRGRLGVLDAGLATLEDGIYRITDKGREAAALQAAWNKREAKRVKQNDRP